MELLKLKALRLGFTPVRSITVTEPEPLKAAVSVLLKPAKVPGAACTPEPLVSVQLPFWLQSDPEVLFHAPLPEKTCAV